MKALGDQCWVNTAINFGTCCKWRLNDVDDDILCSIDRNLKKTEIIVLTTYMIEQWNISQHKKTYTISLH